MRYRESIDSLDHIGRSLFLGFVKLHVLHHATEAGVYGLEMIDELGRHGYDLSAGTLYPILHRMQEYGLLKSTKKKVDGKIRKYYTATPKGKKALADGYARATELLHEISGPFQGDKED